MKKILLVLYIISAFTVNAQDFPPRPDPPKLVNDMAGMLDAGEVQMLENKLVAFDDSTTIQIAVVILTTLDGYPIDDYAFKLGQQWGIGNKKTSNGVLLLISKE